MTDMYKGQPFVTAARAMTMRRDFDKLRQAIRGGDNEDALNALDGCERWFDLISANPYPQTNDKETK